MKANDTQIMKAKIKVHFTLKKNKANNDGLHPIYIRLTVDGKRLEFTTKKYIELSKWSPELAKMKGNSEETRSINSYLDLMKAKIFDIQMGLIHQNEPLTLDAFKNKLEGRKERERMLIPIFEEHNRKIKELLGIEYAPGTYERYQTSLKHTKEFLQWKYLLTDIAVEKIDYAFITEYEFYLRSVRKCANNSAVKYIRNFGKIIKQCIANGWIVADPFFNYKPKMKEVVRVYLTEREIETIINKKFMIERMGQVRDMFIFGCFTGLAYIDMKKLNKKDVSIGIDGDRWIFIKRQKTDTVAKIPLLPMAEDILNKYINHPYCINEDKLLPIMSNQKMNGYLKEIADMCGIHKELTFHIARHTFATTVTLSNGVPIETVSKLLGHTNLKTTQHYAKILDKKISNDMQILKNKYKKSNSDMQSSRG